MTEKILGPTVSGDEIASELRRRKSKDHYKTVTGSTRKIIAQKVELEEADGWRIVRKNAKSTRMAKSKPVDEQLEDEVWCILANMGFKELNRGRNFVVNVEDSLPPRQIDAFAKDDETVIIVECTQKRTPGKKSLATLIEKIRAIREPILKTIQKHYGHHAKLKLRHVVATRNIAWSDADLSKCKEAGITVLADGELDYYVSLVKHLKQAARYQFLGHMFHGQKIDGLARKVLATRGKMGGETFYTFLIRPDELLKIAYVGHKASRDIENLQTYQRLLQPRRLKKIATYINDGGKFPTNIIVNLKTNRKSRLRFEKIEKFDDHALGILHLPATYSSAWIIDGQHRLFGYAYARESNGFNEDKTTMSVLAYENLPAEKEMNLFIDINSKQVKVSTGLLVELYADLHWLSNDPEEAYQSLLSRISSRLNTDKLSPLNDRMIVTGTKKTSYRCLTQTSIRDGLEVAKLLGTASKGAIVPGPISTANVYDYEANLKKGVSVLSDCLNMFATQLANHWEIGDGRGGYLCTNIGIRSLFHVIKDISDHVQKTEGLDLCFLSADEVVSAISKYLEVLVDYFAIASPRDIQGFRKIGSSLIGVRKQSFEMETCIHEKFQDFLPAGLQQHLASRDEAGTDDATMKVTKIHKRLFDYVIGALKRYFGTENKAWWTQGIPVKIRQECSSNWEAKDRDGEEESHLYLINYIDICHNNWDLVKDVISLGAADKNNKRQNTKWIRSLNDIRQITMHPERGVLSTDQVTLVNEIFDKVEKHFPDEDE